MHLADGFLLGTWATSLITIFPDGRPSARNRHAESHQFTRWIRLSELQGRDPLILMLSCGHYCPKEHQQHHELAAFQSKVAVAYTQIVTISTDEHHTLQEFRASVGAQWTFLSDPGRTIQQDLDIQEYTDPDHDPMIPHTLVLKPGLVIQKHLQRLLVLGPPVGRRPLA